MRAFAEANHPQHIQSWDHLPSAAPDTQGSLSPPEIDNYPVYNMPSVLIAPLLTPKGSLCNMPFQLQLEDVLFVGVPCSLEHQQHHEGGKDEGLRLFQVCLALVRDDRGTRLQEFVKLSQQVAAALKHEQLRNQYVSREVPRMLDIREAWLLAQRSEHDTKPDHAALSSQLLSVSSLAEALKVPFSCLHD